MKKMNRICLIAVLLSTVLGFQGCSGQEGSASGGGQVAVAAEETPVEKFCSGCHQAPKPAAHKPSEWPGVVQRMQMHMAKIGKTLSDADRKAVIDALTQTQ
ncbi:MAG: hypothetical protein D6698_07530 [Gammaproteobacteria bacterium]|nr:MAG: hypothetical protein D6698_07530 [Gammaproteobacteria bacterium]